MSTAAGDTTKQSAILTRIAPLRTLGVVRPDTVLNGGKACAIFAEGSGGVFFVLSTEVMEWEEKNMQI